MSKTFTQAMREGLLEMTLGGRAPGEYTESQFKSFYSTLAASFETMSKYTEKKLFAKGLAIPEKEITALTPARYGVRKDGSILVQTKSVQATPAYGGAYGNVEVLITGKKIQ